MASYTDNVRRGPDRWQRAAGNAKRRLNSYGAKLFRERVEKATEVASRVYNPGPMVFEHYTPVYVTAEDVFGKYRKPSGDFEVRRRFYLCSPFCATMQLQLDHADMLDADGLTAIIAEKRTEGDGQHWKKTHINAPSKHRIAHCYVCGRGIRNGKVLPNETPRVSFALDLVADVPPPPASERSDTEKIAVLEAAVKNAEAKRDELQQKYSDLMADYQTLYAQRNELYARVQQTGSRTVTITGENLCITES